MRSILTGLLAISFVLGAAHVGQSACTDPRVATVRMQAEAMCHCTTATNHGQYVKCVAAFAKSQAPTNLDKNCTGAVKKCAAHSICGKAGFVTCCVTKNAVTSCKTKKSADLCAMKGGTVTGTLSPPSGCSSCCDACTNPSGPSCPPHSPSGAFLE
jgi:hypothetical protein